MADLQTTLQLLEQLISHHSAPQPRVTVPLAVQAVAHQRELTSLRSMLAGQALVPSATSLLGLLPMAPSGASFHSIAAAQLPMLPPPPRSHAASQSGYAGLQTIVGGLPKTSFDAESTMQSPLAGSRRSLTEAEKLVVLVKIVLKCLDKSGDPAMKSKVKAIVADCTNRNRMGDPAYTPLRDACKIRLRRTVGELHWSRVKVLYSRYLFRHAVQVQVKA